MSSSVAANGASKRHWIYVLGGRDLRRQARLWERAKTASGKSYAVIAARIDENPSGKLRRVANGDVVYVYARPSNGAPGVVGLTGKSPIDLAELLKAEGLNEMHRDLKLFIPNSGGMSEDKPAPNCFAAQVHRHMKDSFPHLVLYGYIGEVSPRGFYGHKTANLKPGESLDDLNAPSWESRNLRASRNRVRFPQLIRQAAVSRCVPIPLKVSNV